MCPPEYQTFILDSQCEYVRKVFCVIFLWKYNGGIPLFHSRGGSVLFVRQSLKASPYRRPAQVFAGQLLVLAGADGGEIKRRHGGQREEETQPSVRPQRQGELPGQLQVRAPLRLLVAGRWTGPRRVCVSKAQQRGSAQPRRPMVPMVPPGRRAAGLTRPCGMKHVAVLQGLLLGVSAPGGPADALTYIFNHVVYFLVRWPNQNQRNESVSSIFTHTFNFFILASMINILFQFSYFDGLSFFFLDSFIPCLLFPGELWVHTVVVIYYYIYCDFFFSSSKTKHNFVLKLHYNCRSICTICTYY